MLPLSLACLLATTGAAPALGAEAMVLLKNGGVLHGEVTTIDGRYRIVGEGSEMYIAESQVRDVGESIPALYEAWRRTLLGRDLDGRLQLAGWCVRQGLLTEASHELRAVAGVDPQHPRLGLLRRRLDLAMREPPSDHRLPTPSKTPPPTAGTLEVARQLPRIAELPGGALEQFTRRVQPILVNNCTTSGCHRPGQGEAFELNRDWLHGLADQRSTYANLAATLAVIDRNQPEASPLLLAATEPHGGLDAGLLTGRRQRLYHVVAEWVGRVTTPEPAAANLAAHQHHRPTTPTFSGLIGGGFQRATPVVAGQSFQPPTAAAMSSQGDPGVPLQSFGVQSSGVQGLKAHGFGVAAVGQQHRHDQQVAPAGFNEEYQPLAAPRVQRGGRLVPKRPMTEAPAVQPAASSERGLTAAAAPVDEFDPAIFNQQNAADAR